MDNVRNRQLQKVIYMIYPSVTNPSGRTMALGSTQPLTEMSTRCISWGAKAASA